MGKLSPTDRWEKSSKAYDELTDEQKHAVSALYMPLWKVITDKQAKSRNVGDRDVGDEVFHEYADAMDASIKKVLDPFYLEDAGNEYDDAIRAQEIMSKL